MASEPDGSEKQQASCAALEMPQEGAALLCGASLHFRRLQVIHNLFVCLFVSKAVFLCVSLAALKLAL